MNSKGAMKNLNDTSYLLAFFTTVWAIFMIVWLILRSPLPLPLGIAVTACFIALSIHIYLGAIAGYKALKSVPDDIDGNKDKKKSKQWTVIFIIQGAAMALSGALLGSFRLYEYIVPVMLFIVGLHYIPVSVLYHTKIQIYVAVPTVVLAVLGFFSLISGVFAEYAAGICSCGGAVGCAILGLWATKTVKAYTMRYGDGAKPDQQTGL
ncbi:MAG: hypothetical protein LBS18_03240 [Clostridiales bacterium]|jgi:hypothetical protein|nr:hypothetical protein [Clostridiales bacterium]